MSDDKREEAPDSSSRLMSSEDRDSNQWPSPVRGESDEQPLNELSGSFYETKGPDTESEFRKVPRRRLPHELDEKERWYCPNQCGKFYRKTSSKSIRKHLRECKAQTPSQVLVYRPGMKRPASEAHSPYSYMPQTRPYMGPPYVPYRQPMAYSSSYQQYSQVNPQSYMRYAAMPVQPQVYYPMSQVQAPQYASMPYSPQAYPYGHVSYPMYMPRPSPNQMPSSVTMDPTRVPMNPMGNQVIQAPGQQQIPQPPTGQPSVYALHFPQSNANLPPSHVPATSGQARPSNISGLGPYMQQPSQNTEAKDVTKEEQTAPGILYQHNRGQELTYTLPHLPSPMVAPLQSAAFHLPPQQTAQGHPMNLQGHVMNPQSHHTNPRGPFINPQSQDD